jgi:hypothetical protein
MPCSQADMLPAMMCVKNTFIELPEDASRCAPMMMRRINSDSVLVRLGSSSSCHSESDDDLARTLTSDGGPGCGRGPAPLAGAELDNREASSVQGSDEPQPAQVSDRKHISLSGRSESRSKWADIDPESDEKVPAELSLSPSTCDSISPGDFVYDASSEEDCELANQMALAYWSPSGTFVSVADEPAASFQAYPTAGCSSQCLPRPVPRLRGEHSEAAHRAFAAARAAADAHQYNLDTGLETVECLFMPCEMTYWEQPGMADAEAAPGNSLWTPPKESQEATEDDSWKASQAMEDEQWYCNTCGLLKFDVCGNFCAYCGVKFS